MNAIDTLAQFAAGFGTQPLPADVLHHAKRAVVDWHAALYPGLATEPVRILEQVLEEDLDRGAARLANGRAATLRAAALINGTAAHAAEVDDSFKDAMYHPGAATSAAALAAAQALQAAGSDFLRAVVLGYEVSTRIGVALGRGHYRYWHNTGTVGMFGAATAAAALFRLDAKAFGDALATAATFSAGLQQAFRSDSMSKPLHAGRAAEAGVLAASLASRGLRGAHDILDGEAGFGRAMSDGADWSRIGDGLGQRFNIARLTFKNHVGCGHTFAAIDGALELQRRHALRPEQIAGIRIATYQPALDIACYRIPASANEARFSFPYVVATALVHGSVRLSAYDADRLADPATRRLMALTEVVADPELDAQFPRQRGARVRIETSDGRVFEHLQPNRKGDPEEPLTDAQLSGKLLELASPVIGEQSAQQLLQRLWSIEKSLRVDW
jgi:2-methylcitrate dehydratase PrpD